MPIVLGINLSAYASACIMKDGVIVAAIGEERLNRIKHFGGFPEKSILKTIEIANIKPEQIDIVAIGTKCGVFDSNKAQLGEYRLTTRLVSFLSKIIPTNILGSRILRKIYVWTMSSYTQNIVFSSYYNFFSSLGIPRNKIKFYDHHSCHATAAYFCNPWDKNVQTLVFTCDGNGDGVCATVSVAHEQAISRKLEISSIHSIGGLYSRGVKFLGLSPWHDEHKVMGLASWSSPEKARPVLEKLSPLWSCNGLSFKNECGLVADSLLSFFSKKFTSTRFDYFAFSLQNLTESILSEWVRNNLKHYNISNVILSGGVFLNIKVNKKISELPELKKLYIFPSPADDSISIGAALLASQELGHLFTTSPLKSIYLGEDVNSYENKFLSQVDRTKYEITRPADINQDVADLLANNEVIARCCGRMEYGPRALGNRSILANPSKLENISLINRVIKNRDFWMPFGITVMDSFASKYIINPKELDAPYMVLAFDTNPDEYANIVAGTHLGDHSTRPQILKQEDNPNYYDLILKFSKITGIGALLNTSLNLHGEPLVNTPFEALHLLDSSGLKYLVLNEYLIKKI